MTIVNNNQNNQDDRCGTCREDVGEEEHAVCCDECDKWHHTSCEGIKLDTYRKMQRSDWIDEWFCNNCKELRRKDGNIERKRFKNLKIGTLNCRGLKGNGGKAKKTHIAEDMNKYNLEILVLQETHTGGDPEEIATHDSKHRYMIYHSIENEKSRAGTAIAVKKGVNATFKPITDRICLMKIKANSNFSITVINAYAPTLPVSENDPALREAFYEELESVVRAVKIREYLVVAGDFNAKTGREWDSYPDNIGKYGNGELNSNGKELLEFCNRQGLLTNTLFRHKMAHRSTWESPAIHVDKERRNPYRNMIDYIMVRKKQRHTIQDSRSHNGLQTYTDHRLVRAVFNLERLHVKKRPKYLTIDMEKLTNPITAAKYAVNVELKIMDTEDNWREANKVMTSQEKWNMIVEANKEAAKEVLGEKSKKRENYHTVAKMSEEQKMIQDKINSTNCEIRRKELKKERNIKMKEIHQELGKENERKIEREIREIEETRNDTNKMYRAIKNIERMKPKAPLVLDHDGGTTTDPEIQVGIISNFFEKMFHTTDAKEIEEIPPAKMKTPFTEAEVKSAIKSLKNNRSPGIDQITAEHLKCGPGLVGEKIAEILNHTAATGEHPREITTGTLVPLPKPGKKKGPPAHLRPVILLSMIRKILAICLIRRIGDRIDKEIPPTQAAYRSGRGTTEQVLTIKLMAEKAATTPSYETKLLLMDMSKAFDRVERGKLIEELKKILNEDELHLVKVLIKDVQLAVKVGKTTGTEFTTNIGVPQGDCLSPILFTLYLAKALSNEDTPTEQRLDKQRELAPHLRDHTYSKMKRTGTLLDLQYADDIGWAGMNCNHSIENVKQSTPAALEARNLIVNNEKTEEYTVKKDGNSDWKKCKYLGTKIATEEDIKRRKGLASRAMDRIKHISKDRRLSTGIKIRAFNAYTSSIFLYNSETWTVNKATSDSLDSYHRRLLRNALNIKWPQKISSKNLYDLTKETPWSTTVRKRRLRLYGHLLRLPEETPVRSAMAEYHRPLKMARGARTFTWGKNIENDLTHIGIDRKAADEIAQDRRRWRQLVHTVDAG